MIAYNKTYFMVRLLYDNQKIFSRMQCFGKGEGVETIFNVTKDARSAKKAGRASNAARCKKTHGKNIRRVRSCRRDHSVHAWFAKTQGKT